MYQRGKEFSAAVALLIHLVSYREAERTESEGDGTSLKVELAIVMALTWSNWRQIQRMRPLGEQLTELERLVIARESPRVGAKRTKA